MDESQLGLISRHTEGVLYDSLPWNTRCQGFCLKCVQETFLLCSTEDYYRLFTGYPHGTCIIDRACLMLI
jgi:hypothetical protein